MAEQLDPLATYYVSYVRNKRTGERNLVAITSGVQAISMLANSADPSRLRFENVGR